jgi:hypothetical protein
VKPLGHEARKREKNFQMSSLLLPNGLIELRQHLEAIKNTVLHGAQRPKPPKIILAELTQSQFDQLNGLRKQTNRPPLPTRILEYDGRHHFESRHADGYGIEDMVIQILSVLDTRSEAVLQNKHPQNVNLLNPNARCDNYGNQVNDMAAFNVSSRSQYTELFSVIPRGDVKKPPHPPSDQ